MLQFENGQLEAVQEVLTDTFLISAYDVHYGYLPEPEQFKKLPDFLFLDSGGYEISDYIDLSDIEEPEPQKQVWTIDLLKQVLDKWPKEIATMFVSYDHPGERIAFTEQVKVARELFRGRTDHLTSFLIKPQTAEQRTLKASLTAILSDIDELKYFDVIGLTEREIDSSTLERMVNIAKIRVAMDEAGFSSKPMHIRLGISLREN